MVAPSPPPSLGLEEEGEDTLPLLLPLRLRAGDLVVVAAFAATARGLSTKARVPLPRPVPEVSLAPPLGGEFKREPLTLFLREGRWELRAEGLLLLLLLLPPPPPPPLPDTLALLLALREDAVLGLLRGFSTTARVKGTPPPSSSAAVVQPLPPPPIPPLLLLLVVRDFKGDLDLLLLPPSSPPLEWEGVVEEAREVERMGLGVALSPPPPL